MCNNAKVHLSRNNRSENRILQCCLNNRRYTHRPTWSRMNQWINCREGLPHQLSEFCSSA
jgi:hypothetical protein